METRGAQNYGGPVVIGGGAIGIEMAEAFTDLWGVDTTLIEFQRQLLPKIVDWPMAAVLCKHLRDKNVTVFLQEGAIEIDGVEVKTFAAAAQKLAEIEADLGRAEFVLLVSRGGETAVLRVKLR